MSTEGHVCKNCNASFTRKSNWIYHTENNVCKKDKGHKCRYCIKTFTTKSAWYRHMRETCEEKNNEDDDKQKILDELIKLRNSYDVLLSKFENIGNEKTNTINNTINNIINGGIHIDSVVNNYVLVGYGKEDLSRINKIDLATGMKEGFYSSVKLLDTIHFNPDYPEYHNVYISSMKNKYAMLYDGTNWTLVMKEYLIDKIYMDKRNYIEENLDDFLDSLTTSQRNALNRWMNTEDDHAKIKEIKSMIKLLLYNKRNIVTDSLNSNGIVQKQSIISKKIDVVENRDKDLKKDKFAKVIMKEKKAPKIGTKRKNYAKAVKN